MKIDGFVICQPVNTCGNKSIDPWNPFETTFGHTMQEAWSKFLWQRHKINYENDGWYRFQNAYVKRGYCPKKASMKVEF